MFLSQKSKKHDRGSLAVEFLWGFFVAVGFLLFLLFLFVWLGFLLNVPPITFYRKMGLLFYFMQVWPCIVWTLVTVSQLLFTSSLVETEEWCWWHTVFYKIKEKTIQFREHGQMHFLAVQRKKINQTNKMSAAENLVEKGSGCMNKCSTLVNRTVVTQVDLAHSAFISG